MVDLIEASAVVAAAGVLIGVIYYVIDIRHNMKIRELETCRFVSSTMRKKGGDISGLAVKGLFFHSYLRK